MCAGRRIGPVRGARSVQLIDLSGGRGVEKLWRSGTKRNLVPQLATGACIGTLAASEGTQPPSPATVKTTFADGKLNGTKIPVADAMIAGLAIVLANTGGKGERACLWSRWI